MIISKRFQIFVVLLLHCEACTFFPTSAFWFSFLPLKKLAWKWLKMISSVIVCFVFWNGHCWLWSVFLLLLLFLFLISEGELSSSESSSSSSEDGKWFAPICEGATFAWRFTTARVSRTWNVFLLDDRKSNRGVRMCRRSSQLKIKLIFNIRKGYYTNQ